MNSGIYKITNKVNGKVYIGQSKNIEYRFQQHLDNHQYGLREQCLYRAFDKYGIDNFNFEVLQYCDESLLNTLEKYYIDLYDSYRGNGYNMTEGGDGVKRQERCHGVYCIDTQIAYCSAHKAEELCNLNNNYIRKTIYYSKKSKRSYNKQGLHFCYIEDIYINNHCSKGIPCIIFPYMKIVGNRNEAATYCQCSRKSNISKEQFLKILKNGDIYRLENRFMLLEDFLLFEDSTDITFNELCNKYYIPKNRIEKINFINTKIDNLMKDITTNGVYAFTTNGDCVGIYASLKECAQALGVSKPNITRSASHEVDKVGKYIFRCVNI